MPSLQKLCIICQLHQIRYFVVSTYHGFVFGNFSPSYSEGFTTHVINRTTPPSTPETLNVNVFLRLIFWMASSAKNPDGQALARKVFTKATLKKWKAEENEPVYWSPPDESQAVCCTVPIGGQAQESSTSPSSAPLGRPHSKILCLKRQLASIEISSRGYPLTSFDRNSTVKGQLQGGRTSVVETTSTNRRTNTIRKYRRGLVAPY